MSLPLVLQSRLRLPVVASPLFIASSAELVIAQCKAGIVGSFPALNARPQEELARWLYRITDALAEHDRLHPETPSAPFAVNQIVHRSNSRLEQDMAVCADFKVPIVITSLGARPEVNEAVHSWGGIVLHDVISNRFARSAIDKGADGLIAVAAGAGGHAGAQSPFALLQEIREWFDGPLLLGGAIASGRAILAAQAAGADLAYVGSAFLATSEAQVAPAYKEMVVERTSRLVMLVKLPEFKPASAANVLQAFTDKLLGIAAPMRQSMTYDQGREMAMHKELSKRTGIAVYFCDPHSPWQRGSNENMNGLVRQYLTKGTDLSIHSQEQLDAIADEINNRPRKGLGVRSPLAVYRELLLNSPQHSTLIH